MCVCLCVSPWVCFCPLQVSVAVLTQHAAVLCQQVPRYCDWDVVDPLTDPNGPRGPHRQRDFLFFLERVPMKLPDNHTHQPNLMGRRINRKTYPRVISMHFWRVIYMLVFACHLTPRRYREVLCLFDQSAHHKQSLGSRIVYYIPFWQHIIVTRIRFHCSQYRLHAVQMTCKK